MNRAARPDGPAADDARIQLDVCVPDLWLADDEFDAEAENLRRLEGDEQVLLTLQLGQFSDHDWNPVAQELARYGIAVLTSWIRSRLIFARVKHRTGYQLTMLDGWPDYDTAVDLAHDTVTDALNYFRDKVLKAGKWRAERGASLRTYFIGQCLFQFANHYRSAHTLEIQRRQRELLTDDDTLFGGVQHDVENTIVSRDVLRSARAQMTTVIAQSAVYMQAQGYSIKEIATRFNKSEKQIENMLLYQRKRIRKAS
ncbi:hypothetical protein B7C42_07668 [Nocardia cerradoensis]|uniref:Uncharacterized protein n=1 Tax=Nocardia cerradoensis TaxID=85688 RepID=A0A231GUE2_9NOCA|nr:hypothetical protein [Nocardia cerradoensis]OXR40243.1 hypothetical protein B7C42_07668 [Nocardia cerradoensis]